MVKKIMYLLFISHLFFPSGEIAVYAQTAPESIVIGRLTGTLHKPPHSFLGNSPTVGGDRGSVEFRGFRLVRADEKTFIIRPLGDGYFQQSLPPGEYSLVRQRRDRPSYKEANMIRILTFRVPVNSLINLGTLEIALQGKPEEDLFRASGQPKGIYTYRYRYERVDGEEALSAPLVWFREKEAAAASAYSDRITTVNSIPTDLMDSSRFTLRERIFRLPLLNKQ